MLTPSAPASPSSDVPADVPQPVRTFAPTPLSWRAIILACVAGLGGLAYATHGVLGPRGQAAFGIVCFIALAAAFSKNLRAVNWKTIGWGIALQLFLALAVTTASPFRLPGEGEAADPSAIPWFTVAQSPDGLTWATVYGDPTTVRWYWASVGIQTLFFVALAAVSGVRRFALKKADEPPRLPYIWGALAAAWLVCGILFPGWVPWKFDKIGAGIKVLVDCSDKGAEFVFGDLSKVDGKVGFVFAFKALPPIIFVSAFFSVLYYFGVLQFVVKLFAKAMMHLMGTSGAETLSVSANVFMGQTEAPLIVRPFVPRMTESELFTLMASGMAHISGGMMAVYISYGADPVSILCTCVMACPCSLYLAKLVVPELARPVTAGDASITVEKSAVNPIDAAATGIKDGLFLALNVAAMLIGFLAFIALFDAILGAFNPDLSLRKLFGWGFSPVAFLMGVDPNESYTVGQLLGTKLAANEHVAYLDLKGIKARGEISERAHKLAVYALTGFANFASIGIQLGGIGAMAPERRKDLARLGLRALFVGFVVTLINAAVAGVLLG
jgi:CNT family concentrative nucleoside transporter